MLRKTGRWILRFMPAVVAMSLIWSAPARAENEEVMIEDGSAYVLQDGGFLKTMDFPTEEAPRYLDSLSGEDRAQMREKIRSGLLERENWIDLSDFAEPSEGLTQFYWDFLNDSPEMFFVEGKVGNAYGRLKVFYKDDVSQEMIDEFQNVTEDIVSQVPEGLNDKQKILWIHDYIVTHCEYEHKQPGQDEYTKYDAYNVFVEKTAVCQGYSLAFVYLARQLGIETEVVTSSSMGHAWNLVRLNDDYYYVDCTWDDPANDWYEGYCRHVNFLVSESVFRSRCGHTGSDWRGANTKDLTNKAKSTLYDSYFWNDVRTAIPMADGYYAYVNASKLYLRKLDESAYGEVTATGEQKAYSYSAAATDGKDFYYNTKKSLFRLKTDGTIEKIYTLTADEANSGEIYGIVMDKNAIAYNIGKAAYNETFRRELFEFAISCDVMLRLYNPNSGEHFYTASEEEKENLVSLGWQFEGVAWKAPRTSNTPVFRLYNPNAGDHHYTPSEQEREDLVRVGWQYEGIGWYSDDDKGTPLHRLYNPNANSGSHHYTTSEEEKNNLVNVGWRYEGIGWYGLK